MESADQYQSSYQMQFVDQLGDGKDGVVLKTDRGNAVKFLRDRDVYLRERRAYQILQAISLDEIDGHQIPRMVRYDDNLLAIEFTIVKPPFLLDFAATYSELELQRLDFPPEVLEEREQHWSEIFGEKWQNVVAIREAFRRRTGLVLLDLSLNNIRFE